MKFIKPLSLFISIALLSLISVSCDDTGISDNNSNSSLKVLLTDAPGDFESVFIDIQEVRIHKDTDAEMDSTDSDSTEDDDGWVTISDESMVVDLLTLQNGSTITLGETELESGTYNQLRLILGPNNEVVVDGETFALKTPSAQQSGLKLKIDTEIEAGSSYTLLVDFDASQSIVETGNGKYILKPVLRAVNLQETGSVSGVVEPTDFSTSVFTVIDEDTIKTTTAEDGGFQIMGLASGMYDFTFQPDSSGFQDTTLTDVVVEAGEDTDLGTITLKEN